MTIDLNPIVIKADADSLFFGTIGRDFVLQPTLKKDCVTRLGLNLSKAAIFQASWRSSWGACHHHGKPRIFKFNGAAALGRLDVIGAAESRERVEMGSVVTALAHNVDPAGTHLEPFFTEIHFVSLCKLSGEAIKAVFEARKRGASVRKIAQRTIRGVPAKIVLIAPSLPLLIEFAKGKTLAQELRIEFSDFSIWDPSCQHKRRKKHERFFGHDRASIT